MAREYGVEYPERPLMAVLSDLLGIRHFSTSNGGTVRSDFLGAVLEALAGDARTVVGKDALLVACIEAATRQDFDPRLRSPGDTVTNAALQAMVDGILEHGVPGRLDARGPVDNPTEGSDVEAGVTFDPGLVGDQRDRRLAEQAAREGQDRFRTAVLDAYGQVCAITGTDAVRALEAAHITPYRGPATSVVPNGICLRADVHRLWDGAQLAVDENTFTVLLGSAARASTYGELHGARVRTPRLRRDRPSPLALRSHREWCGL
ncbi:HNH endonuclease [Aquipuribacter sp. SD81]|uniref:HNH endonuclease n=1 Tax=Aquipuribacter sp. SD81 TaxID=3127703 RepID=UPI0030164C96